MKQRVYLETSIVSYLTSRPSRDLIVAAHQEVTRQWWERRDQYDLYVSEYVLSEASGGDPTFAKSRTAMLAGMHELPVTEEATDLGLAIVLEGLLPQKAAIDSLHMAMAVVHEMDVLLTWNCRHLANATIQRGLASYLWSRDCGVLVVTTPEQMVGAMWEDPIVAEVRKIRDKIAKRFNYDIRAIAEYMREREKTSGHPIVSPPRRRGKARRSSGGSPRRRSAGPRS